MADIYVSSVQILTNLKNEIRRFGNETKEILNQLNQELLRTQQWLEQRKQYWEARVRQCEENVRSAEAALARCESRSRQHRDDERSQPPDCSSEQMALARAEAELQEAKSNLANVLRWIRTLEDAAIPHKNQAQSMNRFIDSELVKSTLYLEEKASALEDYLAVSIPDSVSTIGTSSGVQSTHQNFLLFGGLKPNTEYTRNSYHYLTDGLGRVKTVHGTLYLGDGVRTAHQTEVGGKGLKSDEGGHIIATIFNGSPEGLNLMPQDANLNRGAWRTMEKEWADALKEGKKVQVEILLEYKGKSFRPDHYIIEYKINSDIFDYVFLNEPKGGLF